MTVGALRAALANVEDDVPLLVATDDWWLNVNGATFHDCNGNTIEDGLWDDGRSVQAVSLATADTFDTRQF
jgi:hypothetical protein